MSSKKGFDPDNAPLLGSRRAINEDEEEYASRLIDPSDSNIQELAAGEYASKKDIFLMICINFLSFVCFAIVLPSLWPFIEQVSSE